MLHADCKNSLVALAIDNDPMATVGMQPTGAILPSDFVQSGSLEIVELENADSGVGASMLVFCLHSSCPEPAAFISTSGNSLGSFAAESIESGVWEHTLIALGTFWNDAVRKGE